MRGQVVRIDLLQGFELLHSLFVAMSLIVSNTQLAPWVPGLRLLAHDSLQVSHFLVVMSLAPFHQREIVKRARVVRAERQRLFQVAPGRGILFPLDIDRKSTRLNSSHLGISYA